MWQARSETECRYVAEQLAATYNASPLRKGPLLTAETFLKSGRRQTAERDKPVKVPLRWLLDRMKL